MESFLADTLTRAESTLSEGQYLTVANILKKIHKDTEQPIEVITLSSCITGKNSKTTFKIDITSYRRVGDDGVFEYKILLNDSSTPPLRQDYTGLKNSFQMLVERIHPTYITYQSRDMTTSWNLSVNLESLLAQCRVGEYTIENPYECIEEFIFTPLFHLSHRT